MAKLEKGQENKLSAVVFSGGLDKGLASMIIATGASAMGLEVSLFFTFWATPLLRAKGKKPGPKDFFGKLFGAMMPRGAGKAKLSQMHMGGMGTAMIKNIMKKKNVASLPELITLAGELDVKITICEMSMDLMGFTREEMIDYPNLHYGGVAAFVAEAAKSKVQLFI
ncbi:MAG: NADH dehydrogenase FAD-containing subunit [Desulfovibrio sp.]|nr:MAG: NADH dehydrogenase FAD-containing subunit [Desulfovibrio sp.]